MEILDAEIICCIFYLVYFFMAFNIVHASNDAKFNISDRYKFKIKWQVSKYYSCGNHNFLIINA